MAGMMYLGNQKVCPVIVQGGGSSETPVTMLKFADGITEVSQKMKTSDISFPVGMVMDFNNIETVSAEDAFSRFWHSFSNQLTIDMNKVETISGVRAFSAFCQNASNVSIIAKNIKKISGNSAFNAFCYGSTITNFDFDFSTIEEISGSNAILGIFGNSTGLPETIRFTNLSILNGGYALEQAFGETNVKHIYFNSLTSQSFGNVSTVFSYMLYDTDGCTVHFPSNLESVIGNWSDVLSGFGGTNTTVLFDLEATS